jgi:hypothetical protein
MALSTTSQNLVALQAKNYGLQTQKIELDSRLGALTEILWNMNDSSTSTSTAPTNPAMVNGMTIWRSISDILGAGAWNHHQPINLYQLDPREPDLTNPTASPAASTTTVPNLTYRWI